MNQFNMNQRTQVRRAGMNKGVAAGLLVAIAGAAYINSSIKSNPRKFLSLPYQILHLYSFILYVDPSKDKSVPLDKNTQDDLKKEAKSDVQRKAEQPRDDNPMVEEKVSSKDTKSGSEKNLEGYAKQDVKDTSVLAKKDTDKVKPVWDENKPVAKSPNEGGFWSNLTGGNNKENAVPDTPVEQDYKAVYDKAPTTNGNPMVYEKRSQNPTKPNWERSLEENAQQNVRDTSTLVGKDTEKVRGVWEDKAERDQGRTPQQTQENSGSFWSHLFGKGTEQKIEQAEATISDKAHQLYNNASEAVYDASDKLKKETDQAAAGLQQAQRGAGTGISRGAGDQFTKSDTALTDMHDSVGTTEKIKNDAKTWYDKGAEQVNNLKSEADKDVKWAGQKVQEGIAGAKDEYNRLVNHQEPNRRDLRGNVVRGEKFAEQEFGQLRPTRDNTKLKPAELIVQNAHGKEM